MKKHSRSGGSFVVLGGVLLLSACNQSGTAGGINPTRPAPRASPTTLPGAAPADAGSGLASALPELAAPPVDPGVVTLIDPGHEPRRELRYALGQGKRQTVEITLASALSSSDVPLPHPSSGEPALVVTLALEVAEVTRASDDVCAVEIIRAETKPPTPPEQTVLPLLVGQRGQLRLNDRGLGARAKLSLTPPSSGHAGDFETIRGLAAQIEMSLTELVTPLPKEPVGKGAKWRHVVKRPPGLAGPVPVTETAIYELVALTPDTLTIEIAIERSATSAVTPANEAASEQTHDVLSKATDKRVVGLERALPTATKRRTATTIRTQLSKPDPTMPYDRWTTKSTTTLGVVAR